MMRPTLIIISAMVLAIFAYPTYALDPPHNSTNSIECSSCHTLHNAPGGAITVVAGNANLCQSCHMVGGQATAKPLVEADQALPAHGLPAGTMPSGTSHRWNSGPSGWVKADDANTSPGSVQSGGAFTGRYAKTYTITITTGGDVDTAIFDWKDTSAAWNELTYDDFEAGWGNYTDGGADSSLYTGGTYAHQGTNAAHIQDDSGTASAFWLTTPIDVDTPGYTEIKVEFWYRGESMESNEDFWLQYYNGTNWQTVQTWAQGIDFNNGVFYSESVSIPEGTYTFPTNMQIRFMCDASSDFDHVYIDEIRISAYKAGGGTNVTTGTDVPLDEGITATFTDGDTAPSFVAGDKWNVYVRTDLNLPTDPEMAARLENGKIMCSTCHDQHSQEAEPFDPAAPAYGGDGTGTGRHFQRINNDLNQMCLDCHSARDITMSSGGSHPVGVLIPAVGDYQSPASLPLDSASQVACMSCHDLHYSSTNDGTLTRDADTNALCTDCHTLADTASGVHFNATTGVLWPGGLYGSTFPEITDTDKTGYCTNCHNPHGWPDDGTPSQDYTKLTVEQTVEVKDGNNMAMLDTDQNPSPPIPSDANDLCLTCHDAQVYSATQGRNLDAINWTAVQHGTVAASGTGRGDLEEPYLTYSANYSRNLVHACTDCHTPHGSNNIFLIRDTINGQSVSVTTAGKWWSICDACHKINSGSGHPGSLGPGSSCSGGGGGCHAGRLHTNSTSW